MTGLQLLPGLTPLDEALKVVSSIGIVLLGSLPFAEILQRLLKNPLEWIGEKNRSRKERYGRIAGGNSKRTAGNRRYEADERKRNRHECSPSGMWHIYSGGTSGICSRCGCSGDRSTSGRKTDRRDRRSLDGMEDHEIKDSVNFFVQSFACQI